MCAGRGAGRTLRARRMQARERVRFARGGHTKDQSVIQGKMSHKKKREPRAGGLLATHATSTRLAPSLHTISHICLELPMGRIHVNASLYPCAEWKCHIANRKSYLPTEVQQRPPSR